MKDGGSQRGHGAGTALDPGLENFDVILVNTSAGKDSQTTLRKVYNMAKAAGVVDRMIAVHADLGRVDWPGTRELAELQVSHYGIPFEAVSRPQGDLLDQIQDRGMFPDSARRFCTSDHKRGQIIKITTRVVKEKRETLHRRIRVLNCLGIRAAESQAREKMNPFELDRRHSNSRREVWTWYPIFDWSLEDVWDDIRESGVPHHRAYDLGMPRLSCVFCVFSSRPALILGGHHNRELLEDYVKVENEIGHSFQKRLSIVDVLEAVKRGEEPGPIKTWEA